MEFQVLTSDERAKITEQFVRQQEEAYFRAQLAVPPSQHADNPNLVAMEETLERAHAELKKLRKEAEGRPAARTNDDTLLVLAE
jgi:hypothetical protein